MKALLTALVCACLSLPCLAQTPNIAPQAFEINANVNFGLQQFANTNLFNYMEPSTNTALFQASNTVIIPANTAAQAVNLSTLFPFINSAIAVGISDVSTPGQSVKLGFTNASTNLLIMAPNGFLLSRVYGALPIVYISNLSLTNQAILRIFVLSN